MMMSKLNESLKTVFFVLILLQIGPSIIMHFKNNWIDSFEASNKVGYLCIRGNIENSSTYSRYLTDFFKDSSIQAILLKIESGGGSAGACQALAFDIENLKKEYPKPIITYTENLCTSGAYEVAAATDHIVATGAAVIGSIGVMITPIFNIQQLLQKYDVQCQEIASGQFKNSMSPFNTLTDEQKMLLQNLADNTYQQFAKEIAYKRHLQLNRIDEWGQGKIFTGQQAYDLKLVDALGSKITAINLLKKHIIPSDRKIEWITVPTKSKWDFLWSYDEDESDIMQTSITQSIAAVLLKIIQKQ